MCGTGRAGVAVHEFCSNVVTFCGNIKCRNTKFTLTHTQRQEEDDRVKVHSHDLQCVM